VRAFVSIPLASLFVFLAAFNVWIIGDAGRRIRNAVLGGEIMLTGRGATPRAQYGPKFIVPAATPSFRCS
jgi:hypothetical protein